MMKKGMNGLMKKLIAMIAALMMLFTFSALAEETFSVEDVYEGVWVAFVDDNFEMYVPSDWLVMEITEELREYGMYYAAVSPDGACSASVSWYALDAVADTAALEAEIAAEHPDAAIIDVGYAETVCYADLQEDALCFAMADQADPGMYVFSFTPAADENMQLLASVMMTSIRPITQQ